MMVQFTGHTTTYIDASWTSYDPGTDRQVSKGRNIGRVEPGQLLNLDVETAQKVLEQPGFVLAELRARATDAVVKPSAETSAEIKVEEPLRP